ncbi:MAG: DNA double-strand break repair nuclease NurA, partial [Chloroflexota bacterium]
HHGRATHVAVDGTSHTVQLSNGAHFILAAAAATWPERLRKDGRADLEILPARYDDAQAASARDLLMRSLEAFVATEAAAAAVDEGLAEQAVLWVDGSLYADLSHMAGAPGQVRWGGGVERAGTLLRTTAALLDLAERHGLWLIGIGKTQRAGFLFDALTATAGVARPAAGSSDVSLRSGPAHGRPVADPGAMGVEPASGDSELGTRNPELRGDRPCDGEVLAAAPVGWSWPLVLDGTHFPHSSAVAEEALRGCPAIVSCYLRPHPADLPLRVDVPASAVGLGDRLLPDALGEAPSPWPAWVPDPEVVRPVIEAAMAAYGGAHAYNGPLYAVDRLVRLSRRELETRYLPICARVAGLPSGALAVDRGRRRFISA